MNQPGHILVAEDDPTDAFFLRQSFRRTGIPITLHFVHDGQEVLDYLQGVGDFAERRVHPVPQFLLLDLKMPRLDGFDVLRWIRKQRRWKSLPVVIFSSSSEPEEVKRAQDLGANSYLVKPHSLEELMGLAGQFKKHWLRARRRSERE